MRKPLFFLVLIAISYGAISQNSPNPGRSVKEQQSNIQNPAEQKAAAIHRAENFCQSPCCNCEPEKNWWEKLLTDPVATFTGLLFVVTFGLVYLGFRQDGTTKTIERAYVKMSHSEPGIRWFEDDGGFLIELEVKNMGNTPADITDVLIRPILLNDGESLPESPVYIRQRAEQSFHAFLVKGDYFFYNNPELLNVGGAGIKAAVEDGTKQLIVFGYVDYIDKFKVRHRSGYVRLYKRKRGNIGSMNNLFFLHEKGYNYDRPRKKGEGNDWG